MNTAILVSILMAVVVSATPLLLAGLGELVAERAGILNLGVEGMMLVGAVAGFAAATATGQLALGFAAGALAGIGASLLFGALALSLGTNQVATGLALTIVGTGLSSLAGAPYVGRTVERLGPLLPAGLSADPVWRVLFGYDAVIYGTVALTLATAWWLARTRPGLVLAAVGESHGSAHALGLPVVAIRYGAIAFGGATAGLAGAYFSLGLTPMWADRLTAGRGWIALALVVFASWNPLRLLLGALFFGAIATLELHAKAAGLPVAPELLAMLPYLATVAALVLIHLRPGQVAASAPACLGKPFATG